MVVGYTNTTTYFVESSAMATPSPQALQVISNNDSRTIVPQPDQISCAMSEFSSTDIISMLYSGCNFSLDITGNTQEVELVILEQIDTPSLVAEKTLTPETYFAHNRVTTTEIVIVNLSSIPNFKVVILSNTYWSHEIQMMVTQQHSSKTNIELNIYRC